MEIVIYRKKGSAPKKPTKAQISEVEDNLSFARVSRPNVQDFFLSGAFGKLAAIEDRCLNSSAHRTSRHTSKKTTCAKGGDAWVVPTEDLGRKFNYTSTQGAPPETFTASDYRSAAQSLLLWIKQNLGTVIDVNSVSVVVND